LNGAHACAKIKVKRILFWNAEEIMNELIETIHHENVAEVALNRPQAFNAFNLEMISELADVLMNLATDSSVKGIALTGRGKAFCAGGDLKWAVHFSDPPGSSFHRLASQLNMAVVEIRRMNKPVVAAINGPAAGAGFALALACDFRILEESAVLTQAYTSNGLSIDGGGTFTLPRIVGFARALEIAALDKPIAAKQALEWGLATRVVEDGRALQEAIALSNELSRISLHSFGWSKKLLNESFSSTFESHIELEREGLSDCANHADGKEGLNAFIEKRKPVFNR
jgi:2-(1,2-epoxy-1,2-dihydrophenyl)acetyl-CoA isomerase